MPPSLPKLARLFAVALSAGLAAAAPTRAEESLDLSGKWRFRLDPEGRGIAARWFAAALTGAIDLPGTLPGQGVGDPVAVGTKWTGSIIDRSYFTAPEYEPYRRPGNIKVPFWLQPETYYVGAAWYQRTVAIPSSWTGRRVVATLERPHWKTTMWLDGQACGSDDSLSVAHAYDLGTQVTPGQHVLTILVDNTLAPDIGENSHSVSDHTQGNWNGIVGRIELTATQPVWIDDLQVYPRARDRSALVRGRVAVEGSHPLPGTVRLEGGEAGGAMRAPLDVAIGPDGGFEAEYPLGPNAPLWDEFTPALHRITAALENGERREAVFGLRDLSVEGHHLEINGHRLFLRGTLECAAHPRTGHPPVDVATWRGILQVVRAHGLNNVRFHSWCPPEEAFVAADELGVYLQVEMASWPNGRITLGDGRPSDAWIDAETGRILRAYGNHPSFALVCACNEPGGDAAGKWLAAWILRHRAKDPRHLYTSGAGWPELPENDYNVRPQPRIQHWGEGLDSRINALPPETVSDYTGIILAFRAPVVSHEIGQWCAYPNFDEIPKYTGYLKARNFEIFRASLAAHHMLPQARDFLMASGKLQALCYKEDIESALRTRDMGGFQLLGLSDFPGQGTALVGVLDAFWEEKGYISAREFRRFCGSTVPLARLERRVFTTDENFSAEVEVAHFGPAPMAAAVARWRLRADDGSIAAQGRFEPRDIAIGGGNRLGRIEFPLGNVGAPARYKLLVAIEGSDCENDWDVWVYPPAARVPADPPRGVTLSHTLDAQTRALLESGGAVVLMLAPASVRPDPVRGRVALGFSSIFWNTAWTSGQPPHTLGILCDPRQPALASFPTDAYSNWQWWYPIHAASAMILDGLPPELRPIVQVVDDWFTNRKLALAFEARIGRGRLLVTSIDLDGPALDPVRLQLRSSLLKYAASPSFSPAVSLSADQVMSLTTQ
ncbi:MAG TPA: hypothetical protein VN775_07245 [Opitutaceae bacterium]|nr:hypothetical protein [Opitutaceae bacterium]